MAKNYRNEEAFYMKEMEWGVNSKTNTTYMNYEFDIDSLYEKMNKKNYRVSRATLYNTIELLLESGLVRKHQFGASFSQYERCYFNNQHDHIIITDTGEVKEFCDPRIQSIKKDIEEIFDIDIQDHSLYLYATTKKKK